MTSRLIACVAALLAAATAGRAQEKLVTVTPKAAERRVEILVDGQPFTAYIWPTRLAKPVLYPIRTSRAASRSTRGRASASTTRTTSASGSTTAT
jgi:hypothetical protein